MSTNHENTPIKHSPGPWRADLSEHTGNFNICSTAPGQVLNLAGVYSYQDDDADEPTAESKANANLIAAAPELLACLKELIHDIEALLRSSEGVAGLHKNGDIAPWDDLLDGGRYEGWLPLTKAEAAIAKAEGK